jgi:RNA polymerase sigma-70 factor (ECF subfamily)
MNEAVFREAYPLARRAAEVRSASVVSAVPFTNVDREDLHQEALMGVWRELGRFDSSRASLRTFVERVVYSKIASALRSQGTSRRISGVDALADHAVPPDESIDLRTDVARALTTLSDGDRKLALLLADHTPTQAGRQLHISRSTVYERIRRIRAAFIAAGLGPRGGVR